MVTIPFHLKQKSTSSERHQSQLPMPGQRGKGSVRVLEYWALSKIDCLKSALMA
jgi:hypothetical protein